MKFHHLHYRAAKSQAIGVCCMLSHPHMKIWKISRDRKQIVKCCGKSGCLLTLGFVFILDPCTWTPWHTLSLRSVKHCVIPCIHDGMVVKLLFANQGLWVRSGPEIIKKNSSSAQLSMKFQLLINVEIVKIVEKFRFKTQKLVIYPANK